MTQMNYEKAGVSIETGDAIIDAIKDSVHQTRTAGVLSAIGGFAGLYDVKEMTKNCENPVLVQSIDGVGTKSLVASLAKNYSTIGHDLVAATANDILVCGAKPYSLLDYVASSRLSVSETSDIIKSIAAACKDANIALLGGETAEMPDTYCDDAYDIVGIVTGIVDKEKMVDGRAIEPGDVVIGLPSTGLHTNGFSLARRVLFDVAGLSVDSFVDELAMSVGEALLKPHKNYQHAVLALLDNNMPITGMAHITGGGIKGNLSRVLPSNVKASLDLNLIDVPPIFSFIQEKGRVTDEDMYQAFNMGVGYIIICRSDKESDMSKILGEMNEPFVRLGEIKEGLGEVEFV